MAAARECAAALEPCCVTYRSTQNPSNECSEERPSRPPSPPLNPHCLDVANYANSLRAMPTDRIARVAMRLAGLHLTHMESCVCDPHAQPRRQHTSRI